VPTFRWLDAFDSDWRKLTPSQQARFRAAVEHFVADLNAGQGFRPGLRVKRVQGTAAVWEWTWAPDGRATWQYGTPLHPGEPHVIWRRIGTHDVLDQP
jgi:hypothetical protein